MKGIVSNNTIEYRILYYTITKPDVNRLEAGNRLSVSERMKETKLEKPSLRGKERKMKRKAITALVVLLVGILISGPMGEELGWRGFLLPRL